MQARPKKLDVAVPCTFLFPPFHTALTPTEFGEPAMRNSQPRGPSLFLVVCLDREQAFTPGAPTGLLGDGLDCDELAHLKQRRVVIKFDVRVILDVCVFAYQLFVCSLVCAFAFHVFVCSFAVKSP